MTRKTKCSFEQKLDAVSRCLQGKTSATYEAKLLGIANNTVLTWIANYQSFGELGLMPSSKNASYSAELKYNAVSDYLKRKESSFAICQKYGIRSTTQLKNWVLKYTRHEKLKSSTSGGKTIMTKGRRTTFDERITIVQHCIEHGHNYNETAEYYQISYQQTRNYTLKYEAKGLEGLKDNRGKRKTEDEMTEVELLRAEIKLLKTQKNYAEMEVSFLKKLKEIERGRN